MSLVLVPLEAPTRQHLLVLGYRHHQPWRRVGHPLLPTLNQTFFSFSITLILLSLFSDSLSGLFIRFFAMPPWRTLAQRDQNRELDNASNQPPDQDSAQTSSENIFLFWPNIIGASFFSMLQHMSCSLLIWHHV